MNIATLIGLISGFSILAWSIFSATGDAAIFWDPAGMAIVLGGVIASTFICYPMNAVFGVFGTFGKALRRDDLQATIYISELQHLAQQIMAGGTVKLEKELTETRNYFLKDALRMLVDRYPPDRLRAIMEASIINARERELAEAAILRTMAKFSPAFGMVGTLIGLIVMFKNMGSDLSAIGPAMAVAMMTTFYGLLFAYLIFLPIAIKIERRIDERALLMQIIMEGVILVSKKTPPQLLVDELKAYLPPTRWQDIKPRKGGASGGKAAAAKKR